MGSLVRLLQFEGGNAHLVEVTLAEDSPAAGDRPGRPRHPPGRHHRGRGPRRPPGRAPGRHRPAAPATRSWCWSPADAEDEVQRLLVGTEPSALRGRRRRPYDLRMRPPSSTSTRRSSPRRRSPPSADPSTGAASSTAALVAAGSSCRQLIYLHLGAERAEAGPDPRVDAGPHQGVGPRPGAPDRPRGARRDGRADHLRRGARADRGPPGRRATRSTSCRPRPRRSSSPWPSYLGVDGAIASRAVVDDEGRYTGRDGLLRLRPVQGRRPCGRWPLLEGIDLAESSAYRDSYTDLPMLEAVGHPVAVNPDRVLAKVAREREWEVRQFTKPVRLRDRVQRAQPARPRRRPSPWRHWRVSWWRRPSLATGAYGRRPTVRRAGHRARSAGRGGRAARRRRWRLRLRAAAWRRRHRGRRGRRGSAASSWRRSYPHPARPGHRA